MKVFVPQPLFDRPEIMIRRMGYAEHRDRHSPEISYTRRLGLAFYPRFHVYIEHQSNGVFFNLHIDQKRPSYGGGTHAHAGEYDGLVVEQEAERISQFVAHYQSEKKGKPKRGFFSRLVRDPDEE